MSDINTPRAQDWSQGTVLIVVPTNGRVICVREWNKRGAHGWWWGSSRTLHRALTESVSGRKRPSKLSSGECGEPERSCGLSERWHYGENASFQCHVPAIDVSHHALWGKVRTRVLLIFKTVNYLQSIALKTCLTTYIVAQGKFLLTMAKKLGLGFSHSFKVYP